MYDSDIQSTSMQCLITQSGVQQLFSNKLVQSYTNGRAFCIYTIGALTPFCLQYSMSVQQSSASTMSSGKLRLVVMAINDDVSTTRLTPASFAAVSTFIVPLIAGSKSCFYKRHQFMDPASMR
jgi:hypothetical protein